MMASRTVFIISVVLALTFGLCLIERSVALEAMGDDQIRKLLIEDSLKAYEMGGCLARSRGRQESSTTTANENSVQKEVIEKEEIIGPGTLAEGYGWQSVKIEAGKKTNKEQVTDTGTKDRLQCECACPYSVDANRRSCGSNNAYFTYPEGVKPRCYPQDISDEEVQHYREIYNIDEPPSPK